MSIIDRVFIFLFSVLLFSSLYVSSTMNALRDSYAAGIEGFMLPFYGVRTVLVLFLIFLITISIFTRRLKPRHFAFYKSISISAVLVSIVIMALGYAPCMDTYLRDFSKPETLGNVITHSLLCPQYSLRSYVWPSIIIFLGVWAYFFVALSEIRSEIDSLKNQKTA